MTIFHPKEENCLEKWVFSFLIGTKAPYGLAEALVGIEGRQQE